MSDPLFDAVQNGCVMQNYCAVLHLDEIVYVGPIKFAPPLEGKTILLNPVDFKKLKDHVDKGRH